MPPNGLQPVCVGVAYAPIVQGQRTVLLLTHDLAEENNTLRDSSIEGCRDAAFGFHAH